MNKILAAEYFVSIGFNTWGAVKNKQVPWPATIVRIGVAFGILGLLAQANEEMAQLLGAGFLLASLLNVATDQPGTGTWTKTFGANPPAAGDNFPYYTLGFANA